jgi:hypothetical protein
MNSGTAEVLVTGPTRVLVPEHHKICYLTLLHLSPVVTLSRRRHSNSPGSALRAKA